jgi:hypothetical protein
MTSAVWLTACRLRHNSTYTNTTTIQFVFIKLISHLRLFTNMTFTLIVIVLFLLFRIENCRGVALFDTLHVLYEEVFEGMLRKDIDAARCYLSRMG